MADVMARVSDAFPKSRKFSQKNKTCVIRVAGGRLYAIPQDGTAMAWYDIDAQTGKLTEKGLVECPPCFHAVVSPDQKDIYLLTNPYARRNVKMGVTWYRLEADGTAVRSGMVTGKGLEGSDQTPYEGVMDISPDGKFLYAISGADRAIACIERKPDGSIAFKDSTSLDKTAPRAGTYPWASLTISGDGKWLYGQLQAYGKKEENVVGVFARDAGTGTLTLKEAITGDKNPLVNQRGWQSWHFAPKGTGYAGHFDLGLWTFQYDPDTGHLSSPVEVKETRGYRGLVAYDFERGVAYMGGVWGIEGGIKDAFVVLKLPAK
jgi:6-phosphogluconolactonase (cycloisomerase 2 family)